MPRPEKSRAERRRIARTMGIRRARGKGGRRPAFRQLPQLDDAGIDAHLVAEDRGRRLERTASGLDVVRYGVGKLAR